MKGWVSRNADDAKYYELLLKKGQQQKQNLVEYSPSSSSSSNNSELKKRKRHDSDSEIGSDDNNNSQEKKAFESDEEKIQKKKKLQVDSYQNQKKNKYLKQMMKDALLGGPQEPNPNAQQKKEDDDEDIDSESEISVDRESDQNSEHSNKGLHTKESFQKEIEKQKQKDKEIMKFAEQFKNQKTIIRDKKGNIITEEEAMKDTIEAKKKKLLQLNLERISEWCSGLIQKQQAEEKKREFENLKNTNFGSNQISKEADKEMQDEQKFGDPMQKQIEKDKQNQLQVENLIMNKQKCKFPGVPNRFGILPGWDGCDRSNGFEKKFFNKQNQQIQEKNTAYEKIKYE